MSDTEQETRQARRQQMVLEKGKNAEAQTQYYKTVLKVEESNIMLEK